MKKVFLIFPDTTSLSSFIFEYKPPNAEVNTKEHSLITYLPEELITIARNQFQAQVKQMIYVAE